MSDTTSGTEVGKTSARPQSGFQILLVAVGLIVVPAVLCLAVRYLLGLPE